MVPAFEGGGLPPSVRCQSRQCIVLVKHGEIEFATRVNAVDISGVCPQAHQYFGRPAPMTPGNIIAENNRLRMTDRENNLTLQISYLRLGKSYPLRRLGRERQVVGEVAGAPCQKGGEAVIGDNHHAQTN